MARGLFILAALLFVLGTAACDDGGNGDDGGGTDVAGAVDDDQPVDDDDQPVDDDDQPVDDDDQPAEVGGACKSSGFCMVLCKDDAAMVSAARSACENNGDTWLDDGACPLEGALGLCENDSLNCKQYCYPNHQLSDEEERENCRDVCSGTFTDL